MINKIKRTSSFFVSAFVCTLIWTGAFQTSVFSQLPESSVYLVPFPHQVLDTISHPAAISSYTLLSTFHPNGYNNQPFFSKPETLFISSGSGVRTNLYRLNIESLEKTQITDTRESEFSPGVQSETGNLSFIRLEEDGAQRLWVVPANFTSYGSPLTPVDLKVGYYQWLNANRLALFVLRENHNELIVWNTFSGQEEVLTDRPGRSMHVNEEGHLYYVMRRGQNLYHIFRYEPETGENTLVVRMPAGGSQDFCIGPEGILITATEGLIMGFRPGKDSSWKPLMRLRGMEQYTISRLAANGDGFLSFVVEH